MNLGNVGSTQNAAAEAMETVAQTKAEAAAGDQQAVQKLARRGVGSIVHVAHKAAEPAQPMQATQPAQPAVVVNGKIDTKA